MYAYVRLCTIKNRLVLKGHGRYSDFNFKKQRLKTRCRFFLSNVVLFKGVKGTRLLGFQPTLMEKKQRMSGREGAITFLTKKT